MAFSPLVAACVKMRVKQTGFPRLAIALKGWSDQYGEVAYCKREKGLKIYILFIVDFISSVLALVIFFRKLNDVISFLQASYINAGIQPLQTAFKQMAVCLNARK